MIKRAQRTFGRLFTVSGVITAFRKSAVHEVGYWSPNMLTEDIDLTWNVHSAGWDVKFEIAKNYGTYKAVYSDDLVLKSYDFDPNITSYDISLERLDGTVMLNVIDEVMIIRAIQIGNAALSLTDVEITVEPFQDAPRWQCATNYANANPLNPLTILSSTVVGNAITTIIQLDTSKMDISSGVSISAELKGFAGANKVSIRNKETFGYLQLPPSLTDEDKGIKECCEPEIKLASLTSFDDEKNDVTGIAILIGGNFDSIIAKLYKDGIFCEDYTFTDMPNQENGVYSSISWRQVLTDYGAGCYSIVIDGTLSGVAYNYTYGTYQLLPYNSLTSKNQFRLRCFLDKFSSSQSINYEGSGFVDDIRYKGEFGKMQPKTKVDNLVYSDRTTKTIINENIPEYSLETRKMKPKMVNRLIEP
jgi:hypothetical protein